MLQAQQCQVSGLLPTGCLIVVGDQAYHRFVVSELSGGVGVGLGHAVVGEQGVQEVAKHTLLRSPHVEDQRGRCGVA